MIELLLKNMHRGLFTSLLLGVLMCVIASSAVAEDPQPARDPAAATFFHEQVLPILKQHCFACHSHQSRKVKGGLVLDSRSGWARGGESGPAIVPGNPDESLLIEAIRRDGLEMPPTGKLPATLISTLEKWVADGAYDPRVTEVAETTNRNGSERDDQHWAFLPLGKSRAPRVKNGRWTRNGVDRFILAKLEEQHLQPVADADRYTWLRRVTFDLTGLPPTPEQIQDFVSDESRWARETVVDRLLGSRAFGERWARHWLDLVGYADQVGTSNNVFAEHAWRYRDYVIDSLNSDKPFDRFIREQIAGDLLPFESVEERAQNLVATGFLVLGDIEIVEADKEKLLVDIVDQQVRKVGKAFLAMTVDCARCHDHKFDPISQRDYYAIAGFFHGTSTVYKTDRGVWSDVHLLDLPENEAQQAEREQRQLAHAEKLAAMKAERSEAQQRVKDLDEQLKNDKLPKEERDKLTAERDKANGRIGPLKTEINHAEFFAPTVPRTHGVHDVEKPGDMRITIRGNPRALGDLVSRGFLSVVSSEQPEIPGNQSGREQLADWVASPDNPLTARVTVNRIWQKLFGEGLVHTVDYFGLPGAQPSHPELLDYLAAGFIRNGWSQKRLIRSLVLSRTYQLGSVHDDRSHEIDPNNVLLWRMRRIRLDAEALRDAMIFVSGMLKDSTGGPAMPLEYPENVGGLDPTDVNPPSFRLSKWRPGQDLERTIYLPVIRSGAQPGPGQLRNVFDFPQPSEFTGRRATTAVPTQALFLMNSPVVRTQAVSLATRLQKESESEQERLQKLWLTLLNRPITESEQQETLTFLHEAGEQAWVELCHALLASNEFLMRL
jgi:hypothetical protein